MADELNLNAYFERIGFAGSIAPTLQTLQALQLSHTLAIPYEDLDPLMGKPPRLDPQWLEQKLIRDRRGGWGYEQNILFLRALRTLEIPATSHAARVLLGRKPGVTTPRTHMVLIADLGGVQYLADVGFGGMTLTAPLRLRPDAEQETPHGVFRITGEGPEHNVEGKFAEDWRPLYRFSTIVEHEIDLEVSNWYAATYPDAFLRNTLLVDRPGKNGMRNVLYNGELRTWSADTAKEKRKLTSVAEIKDVLSTTFGIALPAAEQLDPVLERFVPPAGAA
jgi:N-hydroxyarylamine O-acetyltransferase